MARHTCTAACWDTILRQGTEAAPQCDPFAARDAADAEAASEGAFMFSHEY